MHIQQTASSHCQPCLSFQGQEDVLIVKMSISGVPGNIRLVVRDEDGDEGTSRLKSDSMDLALKAGPSRKLTIDGPGTLECPTRTVLAQLTVRVADTAGNSTHDGNYEVRFKPVENYISLAYSCCSLTKEFMARVTIQAAV